jgi:hypothetical protein
MGEPFAPRPLDARCHAGGPGGFLAARDLRSGGFGKRRRRPSKHPGSRRGGLLRAGGLLAAMGGGGGGAFARSAVTFTTSAAGSSAAARGTAPAPSTCTGAAREAAPKRGRDAAAALALSVALQDLQKRRQREGGVGGDLQRLLGAVSDSWSPIKHGQAWRASASRSRAGGRQGRGVADLRERRLEVDGVGVARRALDRLRGGGSPQPRRSPTCALRRRLSGGVLGVRLRARGWGGGCGKGACRQLRRVRRQRRRRAQGEHGGVCENARHKA